MKKIVMIGMAAGVATAMMVLTGCSSKEHQFAEVAGAEGFLGSRGVVPPPFGSPLQLKNVPVEQPPAGVVQEGQQLPPINEPAIADEDNVLGPSGRLVSVVGPSAAAPAGPNGAVVPPPIGNEVNTAPMIQDLSTGKTTAVAPAAGADVMTMPNGVQAGELTYTVKKGDTLSSIARMYSVDWKDIAIVNGMNKNNPNIKVGQTLKLPDNAVLSVAPATTVADQPVIAPVVTPAQTQKTPAATGKTSVASAAAPRNVAAKPLPADGKYVVVAGDSLWKIGHKYGISPESIRKTNNLTSDRLHIGQVLILRKEATTEKKDGKADATKAGAAAPAQKNATPQTQKTGLSADKHIVVSGDSIWTLAHKYKVKEKDLWQWNKLKSSNLRIGQVLIVRKPANAAEPAANGIPAEVPAADDNQKAAVPPAQPAQPAQTTQPAANVEAGAVVDLSNPAAPVAPAAAATAAAAPKVSTYSRSVKETDTLVSILREYDLTIEQFKQLNPTYKDGEELKVGMEIIVPVED